MKLTAAVFVALAMLGSTNQALSESVVVGGHAPPSSVVGPVPQPYPDEPVFPDAPRPMVDELIAFIRKAMTFESIPNEQGWSFLLGHPIHGRPFHWDLRPVEQCDSIRTINVVDGINFDPSRPEFIWKYEGESSSKRSASPIDLGFKTFYKCWPGPGQKTVSFVVLRHLSDEFCISMDTINSEFPSGKGGPRAQLNNMFEQKYSTFIEDGASVYRKVVFASEFLRKGPRCLSQVYLEYSDVMTEWGKD